MKKFKVWIVAPTSAVGDAGTRHVDDLDAAQVAARELLARPKAELVIIEAPTSFGWAYQYHHFDRPVPTTWACWRWAEAGLLGSAVFIGTFASFEACEAHLDAQAVTV